MRCPTCHHTESRVLESRSADGGQSTRRRRECLRCRYRFTTYERIELAPLIVIKRSGEREPFDRTKLMQSLARAFAKIGIPESNLVSLVQEIESELQSRPNREVSSLEIGELVLSYLRSLNEVAYVRFASVHFQFKSIDDFFEIFNQLDHGECRYPRTAIRSS